MCYRDVVIAARRRWKPRRTHADFSSVTGVTTTGASHTVNAPYVLVSAKTLRTNQTAHRTPLSRSNAVINLVRSIGARNSGRGGVLSVAGQRARSHHGGSVQNLVDGVMVTVLGIFLLVIVAVVSLYRRRRRAVAASRSCDDYDFDDDCVELAEFVTELDDSSHDDAEMTRHRTSSPEAWSMEDGKEDAGGEVLGDITSLTPLCEQSPSSVASSVTSGSTPSDTLLQWQTLPDV